MRIIAGKLIVGPFPLGEEIGEALNFIGCFTDGSFQRLAESILQFSLRYYGKMSIPKRLSCMVGMRWIISEGEKKFGEVARVFRPPSREDPVEHVVGILSPIVHMVTTSVLGVINNATIAITIKDTTITNISCSVASR